MQIVPLYPLGQSRLQLLRISQGKQDISPHQPIIIPKDLSYKIVGLAMQVHTELGYGFLEKVYENALMVLLKENGIKAEQLSVD